jgi:hypothetical protein
MKQAKKLFIAGTFLLFVLSSCQKEDNSLVPSNAEASKIVQQGTWRVSQYIDCGEDETYHFSGYTITFDSLGVFTAVNNSITIIGSWNTGTSINQIEFYLRCGTVIPFCEIDDECWHIIENTTSKIRLEDECGGKEDKDYLTFEKI